MNSTILAAVIGALGAIGAALIGLLVGQRKASHHSILRFLDVHEKNVKRALSRAARNDYHEVEAISRAIVENAKTWRRIQESFRELLDGLITELERALERRDQEEVKKIIRTLQSEYRGKRLAVETELEKSKI